MRSKIIKSWTEENIRAYLPNSKQEESFVTLHPSIMELAGKYIQQYFEYHPVNGNINILEIFSGNCLSSMVVRKFININEWICTDAVNYGSKPKKLPEKMRFEKLNSVKAVEKYGSVSNILLLICPPPFPDPYAKDLGYADYYACYDFAEHNLSNNKYIIFIGDPGNSDGSEGINKYLLENKNIEIRYRKEIARKEISKNVFCVKELFILKIKKNA